MKNQRLFCDTCKKQTSHKLTNDRFTCVKCNSQKILGCINFEMLKIGIAPKLSKAIEKAYWRDYDEIYPPTPYEAGFTAFLKRKSKKDYVTSFHF